jgi:hypothetical protein
LETTGIIALASLATLAFVATVFAATAKWAANAVREHLETQVEVIRDVMDKMEVAYSQSPNGKLLDALEESHIKITEDAEYRLEHRKLSTLRDAAIAGAEVRNGRPNYVPPPHEPAAPHPDVTANFGPDIDSIG